MSSSKHTWKAVNIDGSIIKDADSFHREFRFKFGFPDYYGMNLDALYDCMLDLSEPGVSRHFKLGTNEEIIVRINDSSSFIKSNVSIFLEFLNIIIDVNKHWENSGSHSRILIELV